jgi:hypothetical protein
MADSKAVIQAKIDLVDTRIALANAREAQKVASDNMAAASLAHKVALEALHTAMGLVKIPEDQALAAEKAKLEAALVEANKV